MNEHEANERARYAELGYDYDEMTKLFVVAIDRVLGKSGKPGWLFERNFPNVFESSKEVVPGDTSQ